MDHLASTRAGRGRRRQRASGFVRTTIVTAGVAVLAAYAWVIAVVPVAVSLPIVSTTSIAWCMWLEKHDGDPR